MIIGENKMHNIRIISEPVRDAHGIVKEYATAGTLAYLKNLWRAHPNLSLTYSDAPVKIAKSAMQSYVNEVQREALEKNVEVAIGYACTRDGREITMIRRIALGSAGEADILAQHLYEGEFDDVLKELKSEITGSAGVGHTHPGVYGPVFSHVSSGPELTPYGNDYAIAMQLKGRKAEWLDAPYHLMGAPHMGLFGVVEALPAGRVVFHPWEIDENIDLKRAQDRSVLEKMASDAVPVKIRRKHVRVL